MSGKFHSWGLLFSGNQHTVPTRGGSRYKLPGPGSPKGGPGTDYVAWFFFIFSSPPFAGEPEKFVLPGSIPTLDGPASIRLSLDEMVSRLGFRLLVFWLLLLVMYRPLLRWPQITRLYCAYTASLWGNPRSQGSYWLCSNRIHALSRVSPLVAEQHEQCIQGFEEGVMGSLWRRSKATEHI